jgi:hypothetical protein
MFKADFRVSEIKSYLMGKCFAVKESFLWNFISAETFLDKLLSKGKGQKFYPHAYIKMKIYLTILDQILSFYGTKKS